MKRSSAERLAWLVAALLFIYVCVWPLAGGMIACNDDLKFVRGPTAVGTLSERLQQAWVVKKAFRPLEVLVGAWCDDTTLACTAAIFIQVFGLAALAAGAVALARRAFPQHAIAQPLIVVWLLLSPATTTSAWQADTCSQTWCAALAVWAGIGVWDAFRAAAAGTVRWGCLAWLAVVFVLGCTLKEIFYGWSFGIGIALGVAIIVQWRRQGSGALRAAWILLPVVAIPVAYVVLRLATSGLGHSAETSQYGDRYEAAFGQNVVMNAAFSLGALVSAGPLHLIPDERANIALRALPIAAILASVCMIGAGLGFLAWHRRSVPGIQWGAIFLFVVAGVASLAIALPMESVSDLYGLGPNVASGLLLIACAISLWNPVADDERLICRGIAAVLAAGIALTGLYGVASRSYHFKLTWHLAAVVNAELLNAQAALTPDAARPAIALRFVENCFGLNHYGQVVLSPASSVDLDDTLGWLNRRDPARKLRWMPDASVVNDRASTPVIDCANFPVRQSW